MGAIVVDLRREGESALSGIVTIPPGLTGAFEWNGQRIPLVLGEQVIRLD